MDLRVDAIPEWLVKVTSPPEYDRHTAITGHCHHGNHRKCRSPHRKHGGFHTCIVARDGYPAQWRAGALAAVHLAIDECAGCHCDCHRDEARQLDLWGAA